MNSFLPEDMHARWFEEQDAEMDECPHRPVMNIPVQLQAEYRRGAIERIFLVTSAGALNARLVTNCDSADVILSSIHFCAENQMSTNDLNLHVNLGMLSLSLEEYADLGPGMELRFDRPETWNVSIMLGALTVATGQLHVEGNECTLRVDSLVGDALDRKLLDELSETSRDKENTL